MELLTGKAELNFSVWLINYYLKNAKNMIHLSNTSILKKHNEKTEVEKNALIIEWFDSVEIYIDCAPLFLYNQTIFACLVNDEMVSSVQYKTRSEATQQAIIKSNEIYNNLNL